MSVEKYMKAFLARLTLWASPSAAASVLAVSLAEAFLAATLLGVLGACQTPTFPSCHMVVVDRPARLRWWLISTPIHCRSGCTQHSDQDRGIARPTVTVSCAVCTTRM